MDPKNAKNLIIALGVVLVIVLIGSALKSRRDKTKLDVVIKTATDVAKKADKNAKKAASKIVELQRLHNEVSTELAFVKNQMILSETQLLSQLKETETQLEELQRVSSNTIQESRDKISLLEENVVKLTNDAIALEAHSKLELESATELHRQAENKLATSEINLRKAQEMELAAGLKLESANAASAAAQAALTAAESQVAAMEVAQSSLDDLQKQLLTTQSLVQELQNQVNTSNNTIVERDAAIVILNNTIIVKENALTALAAQLNSRPHLLPNSPNVTSDITPDAEPVSWFGTNVTPSENANSTDWIVECNNTPDDYVQQIYGRHDNHAINSMRVKCKSGFNMSSGLRGDPDRVDQTAYNQNCESGFNRVVVYADGSVRGLTSLCGEDWLPRAGHYENANTYEVKCPTGQKIRKIMGKADDNYVGQIGFVCA